jgi:hypothetical protein
MGLACTLSITREYMEHGGRLLPNCALTVYYLPVYPPYSDYNYGLWVTEPGQYFLPPGRGCVRLLVFVPVWSPFGVFPLTFCICSLDGREGGCLCFLSPTITNYLPTFYYPFISHPFFYLTFFSIEWFVSWLLLLCNFFY